jgi:hypothetical protein
VFRTLVQADGSDPLYDTYQLDADAIRHIAQMLGLDLEPAAGDWFLEYERELPPEFVRLRKAASVPPEPGLGGGHDPAAS